MERVQKGQSTFEEEKEDQAEIVSTNSKKQSVFDITSEEAKFIPPEPLFTTEEKKRNFEKLQEIKKVREMAEREKAENAQKQAERKKKQEEILK